jgi:uncharacterized protein (DUF302 family)
LQLGTILISRKPIKKHFMSSQIAQETYHLSKFSSLSFDETIERLVDALREEGFGIITTIDLKETFKNKLNTEFRNYTILGACNPRFAYEAILEEDKVGVFLPCNVVVQEHQNGDIEVSIIDPEEMIRPIRNLNLTEFAIGIKQSMLQVLSKFDS